MLEGSSAPLASATPSEGDGSMSPQGSDTTCQWNLVGSIEPAAVPSEAEHNSEGASPHAIGTPPQASSRAAGEAVVSSEGEHNSQEASPHAVGTPPQAALTWKSSGLLLLVSLGTLAVLGQLVRTDAAVQLGSEMSVLQATQTKQTTTVEAVAEIMAMKEEVQEMPTKEWVNEQLCKPQTWNLQCQEASHAPEAWKLIVFCFMVTMVVLGTATYVFHSKAEQLSEQIRQLAAQLDATAKTTQSTVDTVAKQLGQTSEQNTQLAAKLSEVETMAKTTQTTVESSAKQLCEQNTQLAAQVDATAKTQWVVQKMATKQQVDGQLAELKRDIQDGQTRSLLLQLFNAQRRPNRHRYVLFVWLEIRHMADEGDIHYVLCDGSLWGEPAKKAFKCTWSSEFGGFKCSVVDVEGLEAQVMERLASSGLPTSTPWTYVAAGFPPENLDCVQCWGPYPSVLEFSCGDYDPLHRLHNFQKSLPTMKPITEPGSRFTEPGSRVHMNGPGYSFRRSGGPAQSH